MTIPFWAIVFVVFLPTVIAGIGNYYRYREFDRLDNSNPRGQYAASTDVAGRAWAAQQNAWEALAIIFSPAVLIAHLAGADVEQSAIASIVYCGARVAHFVFYLANLSTLRSLSYTVALACCVWLFYLAAA